MQQFYYRIQHISTVSDGSRQFSVVVTPELKKMLYKQYPTLSFFEMATGAATVTLTDRQFSWLPLFAHEVFEHGS